MVAQSPKLRSSRASQKLFGDIGAGRGFWDNYQANTGKKIWTPTYWWIYHCKVVSGAIGAVALAAATAQAINLHTAFPNHTFPEDVCIHGAIVRSIVGFTGGSISAATVSVGDAGNDDEWVDLHDIFAAGAAAPDTGDADAVNAAGGFLTFEEAYIPLATIDTTGDNVSAATAGEFEIAFLLSDFPSY
jgi:hypothetical protein